MDSAGRAIRKPFIEHLNELKIRLAWSLAAVGAGSMAGYLLSGQILNILQRPLGETLYFTSPLGGFSIILKVSITFGIVAGLPVVIFNLLKFVGPVFSSFNKLTVLKYMLWSSILAAAGVIFAYFLSLPAALRFLLQFGGENIKSLITAEEYLRFALAYIGGFAIIFQLPLIVSLIDRIKPLNPSDMMKGQRYVILGSFVAAAIITPTPDPFNQFIMAMPPILLYQVSLLVVWVTKGLRNRKITKRGDNGNESEQLLRPTVRSVAPKANDANYTAKPQPQNHIPANGKQARPYPPNLISDILPRRGTRFVQPG